MAQKPKRTRHAGGRPELGHVKLVAYVPPEFKRDIIEEAKQRKKTLGQLIQEAFSSRVMLIKKEPQ